jgi:sigma-B regulation protein RsbU (phosphoserine phosphatase)
MPSSVDRPAIKEHASSVFPQLLLVQGNEQRSIPLHRSPFSVGRKVDRDLVIADPRVSREHASIVQEDGDFVVQDQGSKHGTFVNGIRVERQKLERNDRLEFGARDTIYIIFHPEDGTSNTAREFLSQIAGMQISPDSNDLEKLTLFLEAARKLNTTGVLDEILLTLIETTLKLTHAERGYVFLKEPSGDLRLAAGLNLRGEPLLDDQTFSRSIILEALNSAAEFVVTDTSVDSDFSARQSIASFDLRSVICLPLRRPEIQTRRADAPSKAGEVMGVLYLDSRFASRGVSTVSHDILRAISTEAASLVENARLVQAEEESRRYQQELSIAAFIQQRLMAVSIPEVPYARLYGRNFPCKEIGGDFFDAVATPAGLAVVVADVCGKGVSAALLASTLQGMMVSQLLASTPLAESVHAVNSFFCRKHLGEKYATAIVLRLAPDGELEYVNCGHVQPLIISCGKIERLVPSNLPVGLLSDAEYHSARCQLKPGDRFLLVTDGVTEAENPRGDFFDNERLEQASAEGSLDTIFKAIRDFCEGTPLNDDCTVVEIHYTGPAS